MNTQLLMDVSMVEQQGAAAHRNGVMARGCPYTESRWMEAWLNGWTAQARQASAERQNWR